MNISLGYDCSIANKLEEMGIRTPSPFDWIVSPYIDYCLRTNFKYFLDQPFKKKEGISPTLYIIKKYDFISLTDVENNPEYKEKIDTFLKIMRDPSIHKKLYRSSRDASEQYRLLGVFKDCGYVNYSLKFNYLKNQ